MREHRGTSESSGQYVRMWRYVMCRPKDPFVRSLLRSRGDGPKLRRLAYALSFKVEQAALVLKPSFSPMRRAARPRRNLYHRDNPRLLDHLAFLVPPKMRSDLVATLYDDLDKMRALGWSPRRIRWYLWWQFGLALAPCVGRLIRKGAVWGARALAGLRIWRWIGG